MVIYLIKNIFDGALRDAEVIKPKTFQVEVNKLRPCTRNLFMLPFTNISKNDLPLSQAGRYKFREMGWDKC